MTRSETLWDRARALDHPAGLHWAEVDPAGRDVDRTEVLSVVRGLAPARRVPPPRPATTLAEIRRYHDWTAEQGWPWATAMTAALREHYGPWVIGWRWGVGESDRDGGVVEAWCCPGHTITTPDATLRAVADAVIEWHDWTVELAERFDRFLPMSAHASDDDRRDAWERAVAHLVTVVVDRTFCQSGWYSMCEVVLHWFLTAAGVPEQRHADMIDSAIGGRFESWVEPGRDLIDDVADRLGRTLAAPPHA
ncbi:hypothetical protein [Plantactinospora sp. GCM10030261]|uniref:hypothetical protein n=1 Tax=Plantactinospora sp. GCM10030261 TaxID=3273420 RepID=UPI003617D31D